MDGSYKKCNAAKSYADKFQSERRLLDLKCSYDISY